MGACVLGFVASAPQDDDALHREIKRVVQVVEAYPETGRRVFQTVLNEFERFLDGYFREHNAASREGVSLAQQVEQRETWAIQYTIELRKMLERLPVHEGVRHFLFQVWADVMAHGAVRHGPASEATKALKAAAGDLIWSASAKTSREERAEVLRRLPPLLKTLRDGMVQAGLSLQRQDEEIQALNTALAAAFSARAAALSPGVLQEVMASLEALDELLPGLEEVELDDDLLRDLSGHDSEGLEVVAQGGTMPTPAMLGWARELQVGAWFTLDYRGRQEPVQLAWRGLHKQLILFARPPARRCCSSSTVWPPSCRRACCCPWKKSRSPRAPRARRSPNSKSTPHACSAEGGCTAPGLHLCGLSHGTTRGREHSRIKTRSRTYSFHLVEGALSA